MAFGRLYPVVGFDVDKNRIKDLVKNLDKTKEVSVSDLASAKNLTFSSDTKEIADCNVFIITVPTPIHINFVPDLSHLKERVI